jgi:hypothetical protein
MYYSTIAKNQVQPIVVNAAYIKAVLGRKTDVKDSKWLAKLLGHGLLQHSYLANVSVSFTNRNVDGPSTIPIRSFSRKEGLPNLTQKLPAIFDAINKMANCRINT